MKNKPEIKEQTNMCEILFFSLLDLMRENGFKHRKFLLNSPIRSTLEVPSCFRLCPIKIPFFSHGIFIVTVSPNKWVVQALGYKMEMPLFLEDLHL